MSDPATQAPATLGQVDPSPAEGQTAVAILENQQEQPAKDPKAAQEPV